MRPLPNYFGHLSNLHSLQGFGWDLCRLFIELMVHRSTFIWEMVPGAGFCFWHHLRACILGCAIYTCGKEIVDVIFYIH